MGRVLEEAVVGVEQLTRKFEKELPSETATIHPTGPAKGGGGGGGVKGEY